VGDKDQNLKTNKLNTFVFMTAKLPIHILKQVMWLKTTIYTHT